MSTESGKTCVRCPNCNGQTKVNTPPWIGGDQMSWTSSNTMELYECQTCKGKGFVVLYDELQGRKG